MGVRVEGVGRRFSARVRGCPSHLFARGKEYTHRHMPLSFLFPLQESICNSDTYASYIQKLSLESDTLYDRCF